MLLLCEEMVKLVVLGLKYIMIVVDKVMIQASTKGKEGYARLVLTFI